MHFAELGNFEDKHHPLKDTGCKGDIFTFDRIKAVVKQSDETGIAGSIRLRNKHLEILEKSQHKTIYVRAGKTRWDKENVSFFLLYIVSRKGEVKKWQLLAQQQKQYENMNKNVAPEEYKPSLSAPNSQEGIT